MERRRSRLLRPRRGMLAIMSTLLLVLLAACGGGQSAATSTSGPGAAATSDTSAATAAAPATKAVVTGAETATSAATMAATSGAETATTAATMAATSGAGTATTAATAAATSSAGGSTTGNTKGKIQIAVVKGAMQDTMNKLAKKFMDANPGTTVEVVQEPDGGAFEALIAAGNQPDLITGSFGSMPAKYASLGALVPLDALDGAQELFTKLDKQTLVKDLGHNYYLPLGIDITAMIYNKDLFKEAGLDPEKPPQTFAEFLDAAKKIQALPARSDGSKVYGTVFWNEALTYGGWYWNVLQPMYLNSNQNQCQLLNRLGTDVVFDQPQCKMDTFFNFVKQAQQYAPPTMEKNFFSRTIGMWPQYGYSWEPNLKTAAGKPMEIGKDVGVVPVPVPQAGQTSYTTLGGRPLMIMKTTPDRQAVAWKFAKFLMEDANNLQFIKELGYLPAVNSLKTDPYFAEPARKPFVDLLQHAVYPQSLANFDKAANAILGVYQETVIQGKHDPVEAVKLSADKARAALKQ